MKQMMGLFVLALNAVAVTAVAGDLTVSGSLNVTSNLTTRTLVATNATVGSLAVSGSLSLAPGSITSAAVADGSVGTNDAAMAQWNGWADGRYLLTSSTTNLVLGTPGRIVAGYGLNLTNIQFSSYGSSQMGYNTGTQSISMAKGATQQGNNTGTQKITLTSHGAEQRGNNSGTQTIISSAGASQSGYNLGTMMIGTGAYGAEQRGYLIAGSVATNAGKGSIQLLNLTSSQKALITGHASIGLGACMVTNDQSIVAGDGLGSSGKGSITAYAFYGSGSGITNLNLSTYVGDNLTWTNNKLNGASAYTDARAVSAVTAANLDMQGHKVTGLADAVADTDAVNRRVAATLVQTAIQQALLDVGPFGNLSMGQFTSR